MNTNTKDKYDAAIEYLTQNPSEIYEAWNGPVDHVAGCLFQAAGHNGTVGMGETFPQRPDGLECGCLTTIRKNDEYIPSVAWTDELTAAIRADDRLPKDPREITVAHLPIFAEWQRRIDAELGRE